jgi:hypothetical protein
MKYFLLVIFFFICTLETYAQQRTRSYGIVEVEINKEKRPKRVYARVEITGTYPGEDSTVVQTLEKKLNESIKLKNRARAGKYTVNVRYLVERDGSVADISCMNDPGFGLCKQVLVVIKRAFFRGWHPGTKT